MQNKYKATYDQCVGEELDEKLVPRVKTEELRFFTGKDVWEVVPARRRRRMGVVPMHPDDPSRLVAQEARV